ncbi:MAG TPA: YidB family protein [Spirochaetota bacterium]|nr:YidB family protein [Spirochaetota bacterium]HPC41764.1 YidB family protein [Spirochaetota bacterium]HPL16566.1 YidB family protein [Spirochaetota bacterium]HQF06637.1 YidB family protein [Spirochaetota bacterium]HQH95960.1 YidB family protein [Spirochaetota bacterium]
MGLLDQITDIAKSLGDQKGANQGLLEGVADLLKGGGLRGLVDAFMGSGLDEIIKSWLGTGSNNPITADQLKNALGPEKLEELASRAGIPADQATKVLKDILPDIIDRLTPNGNIPE